MQKKNTKMSKLVVVILWCSHAIKVARANGAHDVYGNPLPDLAPQEIAITASGQLGDQTPTIPYWSERSEEEKQTMEPPYSPPPNFVYNTSAGPVPGKINVHLVPHSHDDVGWQVTVDQYFYEEVFFIYDTVTQNLEDNPDRKFIAVETGFFARWWDEATPEKKQRAQNLVDNGQLEFINGGWCMHDEATPTFVEMTDQTTRGHQFLLKNLNATPRGTWSIDPFGHTNTQAWLLSHDAGMPSLFWGRMDYQDRQMRLNATSGPEKGFEYVWQGSTSLPDKKIFAGNLFGTGQGGYSTWINFDGTDNEIQDDPDLKDYNVDQYIDKFVQNAIEQDAHLQTEHQMWACGTDFQYQDADHWYQNLDKLIHYVNQNGTVNAFYSTPTTYTDYAYAADDNQKLYQVRGVQDDQVPLADDAHDYWSGFFTSRPALKRQVRKATNLLAASRFLELIANVSNADVSDMAEKLAAQNNVDVPPSAPRVGDSWTDGLEGAVGLATHHDGMSGTERQDVTDDYSLRIAEQATLAEIGLTLAMGKLAGLSNDVSDQVVHCNCNGGPATCLNASSCAAISNDDVDAVTVLAFNSLGQKRSEVLLLPVNASSSASSEWACVAGPSNTPLETQLLPIDDRTRQLPLLYLNKFNLSDDAIRDAERQLANKADFALAVKFDDMPPLGLISATCTRSPTTLKGQEEDHAAPPDYLASAQEEEEAVVSRRRLVGKENAVYEADDSADFVVARNRFYELRVAKTALQTAPTSSTSQKSASGMTIRLTNLESNVTTALNATWGWYNSSVGGCTEYPAGTNDVEPACSTQKSGAYIFRPNSSELFGFGDDVAPSVEVVTGPVVTEVRFVASAWASHVFRLYADAPFVEVEWTAGPIPIETPWFDAVAYEDVIVPTRRDPLSDDSGSFSNGLLEKKPLPNRWGKELILRFDTELETSATFYTDSNGREMVERVRDKRGPTYPDPYLVSEPVAGNYYPVTVLAAVDDVDADAELAVAVDTALGAASLQDGSLEFMVHRRLQDDDNRGVQEPLNETMCGCNDINAAPGDMGEFGHEGDGGCLCDGLTVRGKMWLVFDAVDAAREARRQLALRLNYPPTLGFVASSSSETTTTTTTTTSSSSDAGAVLPPGVNVSALETALPPNVQLVTLTSNYAAWHDGAYLLRFAHLYQVDEHPTLATPATVDLSALFSQASGLTLIDATETTLTANQPKTDSDFEFPNLTIAPMEVRTFLATFAST